MLPTFQEQSVASPDGGFSGIVTSTENEARFVESPSAMMGRAVTTMPPSADACASDGVSADSSQFDGIVMGFAMSPSALTIA